MEITEDLDTNIIIHEMQHSVKTPRRILQIACKFKFSGTLRNTAIMVCM